MDGSIKSMPVAIIIGMTPAACHMAMSQPMSRNICITTMEVFAPVQDRFSSSFGCVSFAIEHVGHDAPYHNQGVTNSDAVGYGDEDDEDRYE